MTFTVIIPARFASTRLPGKPLADINGKPLIQHVYEQALKSSAVRVIVATDDERIKAAVEQFGGEVCMTAVDHVSGTDRLQEVTAQLKLPDDAIIVNVQGDEPLIPPEAINQVANNLAQHSQCAMATLCEKITERDLVFNPNVVKVVSNVKGEALYFSRAPIPWARDAFSHTQVALPANVDFFRHIGIYAYRVGLLNNFITWPAAPLELTESLEQLRAMYYGSLIHVAQSTVSFPGGVDTPEDLIRVRKCLAG